VILITLNLAGKLAAVLLVGTSLPVALACWFLPDALLAWHVFSPNAQGLLPVRRRFDTPRQEVWLTLDDGPDSADTPRILALLAEHDARATFFLIGQNAAAHAHLVRAIAGAGHEIAHHTHTHPLAFFWCASPASVRRELDDALAVFSTLGVPRPVRFRAPAGIKNIFLPRALATRRLACIGWSARGLERRLRTPEAVAARLTRALNPGAILLLHEGPAIPAAVRVEALRLVLENLRARGYRCVIPSAPTAN
jgi:peptidoglycan/xylan/chitin deacetylase (PgdA/CDA1 family)